MSLFCVSLMHLPDKLPLLPPQILTSTFPTLSCRRSIPYPTLPTDLHVEPSLLSDGLFEGISDRQTQTLPSGHIAT